MLVEVQHWIVFARVRLALPFGDERRELAEIDRLAESKIAAVDRLEQRDATPGTQDSKELGCGFVFLVDVDQYRARQKGVDTLVRQRENLGGADEIDDVRSRRDPADFLEAG